MTKNINILPTASPPRALILGAGVAGLAAAIRFAFDGASVRIVEPFNHVGGKLRQCVVAHPEFQDLLFRFDTGPTHLTLPYVLIDLFAAAGEEVREHLPIQPIDPVARYVWPDRMRFDFHAGEQMLRDELNRLWPKDVEGFFQLLSDGRRAWEQLEPEIGRPLSAAGALRSMRRLVSLVRTGAVSSFSRLLHRRIASTRLRQAITHFVGARDSADPALDRVDRAALLWIAHYYGVWHLTGGMHRLAQQLERLARKLGVQIDTNSTIDTANIDPDVIVVDVGEERSAPALLLGVEWQDQQLAHRTVYFPGPDPQTIEIYAPTRTDPTLAPPGCESLIVRAWPVPQRLVDILESTCGLTDLRRRTRVQQHFEAEPLAQPFHRPHTRSIVIPSSDLIGADPGLLALAGLRVASAPTRRAT